MECTEIIQVEDVEITDYLLEAVIAILVAGLIISTIIIIVIVCICFRKYICRKVCNVTDSVNWLVVDYIVTSL